MDTDTIQAVADISLFSGLGPKELAALAAVAEVRRYARGQDIFFSGDPAEGFFSVASGKVRIYQTSLAGKEHILHVFGPGEVFAEVAVFAGGVYPANAQAMEDGECLFFPRERFRKLLAEDGMVVVVLSMSSHDHRHLCEPEIVTRGFVYVKESENLIQELKGIAAKAVDDLSGRKRKDDNEVYRTVRSAVSTYLYKTTKRSPMVIPVITKL